MGRRACFALLLLGVAAQNIAVARVWFCQIRSASFPTTEGAVLEHKKVSSGKNTKLVIGYGYEVNGTQFVSSRYWYESLGPNYVTEGEVAARFPVGARVPVSYNPADPADAVLIPGLQGVDVFSLWLLWLINWFALLLARPEERVSYSAPRIRATPSGWRLILKAESFWWAFGWVLVPAFAVAFIIARGNFGLFPSVWQALGLTAAACFIAGAWVWLLRSKVWLDVNTSKRELRWHSGAFLAAPFALPFETVTDVRIGELNVGPTRTLYGVDPPGMIYRVEIDWYSTKHRTRTIQLPTCNSLTDVEAAVARLRETVFGATPAPKAP